MVLVKHCCGNIFCRPNAFFQLHDIKVRHCSLQTEIKWTARSVAWQ